MSYNVYTAEKLGSPNHVGIFVQTETDEDGRMFHVVGNILVGMTYENKECQKPEQSATFVPGSKVFIGTIQKEDMASFEAACEAIPVPGAQLKLNGKPIDPSKPIRRCGEWVQEVKEKLIADGILHP